MRQMRFQNVINPSQNNKQTKIFSNDRLRHLNRHSRKISHASMPVINPSLTRPRENVSGKVFREQISSECYEIRDGDDDDTNPRKFSDERNPLRNLH